MVLLMHKMLLKNCGVNELFKKEQPVINFFIFFKIASKLEKVGPTFSSFNPFPYLPSVATIDRKLNIRHDIVLNNKPRPLF